MATVEVGGRDRTVQEFSGRRAIRTARVLKEISEEAPAIFQRIAAFTREYRETNVLELERSRARFEFPDETKHLTEEDWTASGGMLRLPRSPSPLEVTLEVFPLAIDMAEDQVAKLLALAVISNEDMAQLKREGGNEAIDEQLVELGEDLLDEPADDLMALAAVMAELVQSQFADRYAELQDKIRPLRRLFGMDREAQPEADLDLEAIEEEPTGETPPAPGPQPAPQPAPEPPTPPGQPPTPPPPGPEPTPAAAEADGSSQERTASRTPRAGSSSGSPKPSDTHPEKPSTNAASESSPTSVPV